MKKGGHQVDLSLYWFLVNDIFLMVDIVRFTHRLLTVCAGPFSCKKGLFNQLRSNFELPHTIVTARLFRTYLNQEQKKGNN